MKRNLLFCLIVLLSNVTICHSAKSFRSLKKLQSSDPQTFGANGGFYELAKIYADPSSRIFNLDSAMHYIEQGIYYAPRSSECIELYAAISDSLYISDLWNRGADVQELMEKAFELYTRGKYDMAGNCIEKARMRGDINKYANIYGLYLCNCKHNPSHAYQQFQKAAEMGDPIAMYNAAAMLYAGWSEYDASRRCKTRIQDKERGLELYRQAMPLILKMNLYNIHPEQFIVTRNDAITLQERLAKIFRNE